MVLKLEKTINFPNFIECETVEEANTVNLEIYRFERYSDTKGRYIFVVRQRK